MFKCVMDFRPKTFAEDEKVLKTHIKLPSVSALILMFKSSQGR